LSKIINIALASCKVKEIVLPNKKRIRPQIHLLMRGSVGSGKSSILNDVAEALDLMPQMGLTRATLLGSFDKQSGIFTPPAVWRYRNKPLLIDEFYIGTRDGGARDALNTMLSLMEYAKYEKAVGYRGNEFSEEDGDMFCKVKNNIISCRTKFLFFANTMQKLERSDMIEIQALQSRCITIPYYPSLDDLKRKLNGEPYYIYQEIVPKKEFVKISKKTQEKIIEMMDLKNIKEERYLRLFGDLCRVYAVLGKIDKEIFDLIIGLGE